jgi:hypothetical protein
MRLSHGVTMMTVSVHGRIVHLKHLPGRGT